MSYSKKEAIDLVNLDIENYIVAANFIEPLIEVVRKFDGKILNVKFTKAIQEINPNIRCIDSEYRFELSYWKERRYVSALSGQHVNYGRDDKVYLMYAGKSVEDSPIIEKRIVAENIIKHLLKSKDGLEERITDLAEQLQNIDSIFAEQKRIKELVNNFHLQTDNSIIDYFGLSLR